jgi:PhnB protein
MTQAAAVPIREGFRTVTPYVTVSEGAKLIDFLRYTFGAEELLRSPSTSGFHAEVRIAESILMIGSGESKRGHERIGAFHTYVSDCDAVYQRAIEAGATSMSVPGDRPYGERSGSVKDFAGNHWYIATRFASNVPPEGLGTVTPFLTLLKVRPFIDFVKQAFAAKEMAIFEESGRVVHAAARIGDTILEMGEARSEVQPMPSRFFLYVDKCDAWYQRAIGAGATSIEEPADKFHGHRTAVVLDPFGYEWITASLLPNVRL